MQFGSDERNMGQEMLKIRGQGNIQAVTHMAATIIQ